MKRTRHSPEQTVVKLREADALLATGTIQEQQDAHLSRGRQVLEDEAVPSVFEILARADGRVLRKPEHGRLPPSCVRISTIGYQVIKAGHTVCMA